MLPAVVQLAQLLKLLHAEDTYFVLVTVSVQLTVQLIPMPQQQVQLLPGACCQGLQE